MAKAKEETRREGWQAEKNYSQRVYHYIVGADSLCGRFGFYLGEVMPHKPGQKKGHEDCAECYRRAEKRAAKAAATVGQ